MEKFTLTTKQTIIDDSQMNLYIYPDHFFLHDKIGVFEIINLKMDINSQITDAVTQYTPILFDKIQEMDNIPQYIKDNIEL